MDVFPFIDGFFPCIDGFFPFKPPQQLDISGVPQVSHAPTTQVLEPGEDMLLKDGCPK